MMGNPAEDVLLVAKCLLHCIEASFEPVNAAQSIRTANDSEREKYIIIGEHIKDTQINYSYT